MCAQDVPKHGEVRVRDTSLQILIPLMNPYRVSRVTWASGLLVAHDLLRASKAMKVYVGVRDQNDGTRGCLYGGSSKLQKCVTNLRRFRPVQELQRYISYIRRATYKGRFDPLAALAEPSFPVEEENVCKL